MGRGTTSPAVVYGDGTGAAEVVEGSSGRKRTVWSIEECVALANAWISVVEDPYVGANQHIDRMWWRISQSYLQFKPLGGKAHNGEQCRKQWERLRRQISRFAGIYTNNLRKATSCMSAEDVKFLSHQQYIDTDLGFGEFKYWEVYLVVQTSAKFSSGVEAGWPKRTKISASGEYSSSAGSHELPPPRQRYRHLYRRPAAVARLGKSLRRGWLGEAAAGPLRSNRQLLTKTIPSSPHSPASRIMIPCYVQWLNGGHRPTACTNRCLRMSSTVCGAIWG